MAPPAVTERCEYLCGGPRSSAVGQSSIEKESGQPLPVSTSGKLSPREQWHVYGHCVEIHWIVHTVKYPRYTMNLKEPVRGYMRFSLRNGCMFLTKYTSFCNKNDQYLYTFPWYLRSTLTSQRYLLWNALCILSCLRYKVYVDFTLQKQTPKHESTQIIPL